MAGRDFMAGEMMRPILENGSPQIHATPRVYPKRAVYPTRNAKTGFHRTDEPIAHINMASRFLSMAPRSVFPGDFRNQPPLDQLV